VPRAPRRALAIRPMVVVGSDAAVGSDVMGWSRLLRSVQMQRTHQMLGRDMKNAFVNKKKIFFLFWMCSGAHFVSCFPYYVKRLT
jgi:hypothetical protein